MVTARYMKRLLPGWYVRHRNGQLVGAVAVVAGVLIMAAESGWARPVTPHAILGLITTGLMALAIVLGNHGGATTDYKGADVTNRLVVKSFVATGKAASLATRQAALVCR